MANSLMVQSVTQNSISVSWDVGWNNANKILSMPFGIISDSHPISFTLVFSPEKNMQMWIYSSTSGRAIVKLIVESSDNKKTLMAFIKNWKIANNFTNLGELASNKSVKIQCHITWLGRTGGGNCQSPHVLGLLPFAGACFDNSQSPDFYINIGNEKLPAHKAILSRHSEVLAAMFETPMKESKENEVTMNEVECSTMKIILKIIYTGVADDLNDIEVALKVLKASEMYQMLAIKSASEAKLLLHIQDDNVLRLLDEAEKHCASNLCSTCVEYITARNGKILSYDKLRRLAAEKPAVKDAIADLWFSFANGLTIEEI